MISAGHPPDSVRRYSLRELQGFLGAISRQYVREAEDQAAMTAALMGAARL